MKHCFVVSKIMVEDKFITAKRKKALGLVEYLDSLKKYANKNILSIAETNEVIVSKIRDRTPFCVSRLGAAELFVASSFEFDINFHKQKSINQLALCAGFFPKDISLGSEFNECIKNSCSQIDLIGISAPRFEEYYIKKYMPENVQITRIFDLEPWKNPNNPWTKILEGKRVLVIHPFKDTILAQYKKRKNIFSNTNVLPTFELSVLKAVQTVAGETDDRFKNWFDALEWMVYEALKIDFDIAIIGCGAYGLPLAARLKEAGKQAIHLGGATQLLFGIRGKRWDEDQDKAYVRTFYNDAWIYPRDEDKPRQANKVEGGCYW